MILLVCHKIFKKGPSYIRRGIVRNNATVNKTFIMIGSLFENISYLITYNNFRLDRLEIEVMFKEVMLLFGAYLEKQILFQSSSQEVSVLEIITDTCVIKTNF